MDLRGSSSTINRVWRMLQQDQHSPRALLIFLAVPTGSDSRNSLKFNTDFFCAANYSPHSVTPTSIELYALPGLDS
ncbi:unnamed protein product [Mesocestoides corti]|uniref:Uncharacterized protein n=2 Tax=Mesocestoides corti TaxID=53468 RepID=A0A0R3UKB2_MESCO|nr:unnamed protein product [Mesocestoides corti]